MTKKELVKKLNDLIDMPAHVPSKETTRIRAAKASAYRKSLMLVNSLETTVDEGRIQSATEYAIRMETELAEANLENDTLHNYIQDQNAYIEDLKEYDPAEPEARIKKLEGQLEQASTDNAKLEAELDRRNNRIKNLKERLAEPRKDIPELGADLDGRRYVQNEKPGRWPEVVEQKNAEIDELLNKLSDAEKEIDHQGMRIKDLTLEVDRMATAGAEAVDELFNIRGRLDKAHNDLKIEEARTRELTRENAALRCD